MTTSLFRRIDPGGIDFAGAILAWKTARISAWTATPGERVATVMKDGHVETVNTAHQGDMIVTNPSGERYIVKEAHFRARYREIEPPGTYEPRDSPVAVMKLDESVEFVAPWGEVMRIKAGGVLVRNGPGDVYGIQAEEFAETYSYVH